MKTTIYHNPRCQKSRQTLELLQKNNIEPEIVEYLKTPFTKKDLQTILDKLGIQPSELIRSKEDLVKKMKLDLKNEKAVLEAMVKHPELVERPIVVRGADAILGRPPENVLKMI
ncbi:MAG: arsenate reductase (glutaredoxin) [Proteobacteria bacterium]|jgi:arsenate reductase|nr:arsenate reductase (glutaredoxin) [Pseudomonadota bacterium]